MKRAFRLLVFFTVLCGFNSCMDDDVKMRDGEAGGGKYREIERLGLSDEAEAAGRAGYDGNAAELEKLKGSNLVSDYCAGAALAGHNELVLQCLEHGATPSAALWGATMGGHTELAYLMLSKGADPNDVIEQVARTGDDDAVTFLIDCGADVDMAIVGAAIGGREDTIRLLIDRGADPNFALLGAASAGQLAIIKQMLAHPDVYINATDHSGRTALDLAEMYEHEDCARYIYSVGGKCRSEF